MPSLADVTSLNMAGPSIQSMEKIIHPLFSPESIDIFLYKKIERDILSLKKLLHGFCPFGQLGMQGLDILFHEEQGAQV
jgi:hypothetical protein